jgi:PQQ-dependent dehydrogenase (s-GDH family)
MRCARPLAVCWGLIAAVAGIVVSAQNPRDRHNTGTERFTMRVLVSALENPWEVTWGPDGFLWVTERTGFRVTRVNPADGTTQTVLTLTDVHQSVDQDGLLGMAFHPDLLRGRGHDFVYLAYVYDADHGSGVTRRLRLQRWTYDPEAHTLNEPVTLLDNMPAHDDHGGGRIVFGPDGKLYLSRGDLGSNFLANYCNANRAQDVPTAADVEARNWTSYQGKILRLELDGSIPGDNPVIDGVRSHVYTYGHRNTQGLVFGPENRLYESEHGPSSDDEVNLIEAGRNYGWPNVAGYKDDRGYTYANWSKSSPEPCQSLTFNLLDVPRSVPQQRESEWQHPAFTPPLVTFFTVPPDFDFAKYRTATIAPGGLDLYTSGAIPGWKSSLLLAGMRAGAVYRMKLSADGRRVDGEPVEYFKTTNRYRDLAFSPDGRRIFLAMDDHGSTQDGSNTRTTKLDNPGAILEFTYAP